MLLQSCLSIRPGSREESTGWPGERVEKGREEKPWEVSLLVLFETLFHLYGEKLGQ